MKDLSDMGFEPPDLGFPEGNCKHGHPWKDNLKRSPVNGKPVCASCQRASSKSYREKMRHRDLQQKASMRQPASPRGGRYDA